VKKQPSNYNEVKDILFTIQHPLNKIPVTGWSKGAKDFKHPNHLTTQAEEIKTYNETNRKDKKKKKIKSKCVQRSIT
jgi:hypothetical protein